MLPVVGGAMNLAVFETEAALAAAATAGTYRLGVVHVGPLVYECWLSRSGDPRAAGPARSGTTPSQIDSR
jgi:hypothetical protein